MTVLKFSVQTIIIFSLFHQHEIHFKQRCATLVSSETKQLTIQERWNPKADKNEIYATTTGSITSLTVITKFFFSHDKLG